ncbi:MAG TPA: hypothetical protein VLC28_10095, partial [Flavitalea sp.]|nr:hypothetical protein [Flavitalea sp.]
NILKSADTSDGGFGRAPKFPQSFTIRFLLHNFYHTSNEAAKKQALVTLDKMAMGGIYDQLRGGFARYSTDTEWLAPHFEKMLYDNALLVSTYSEAYQLTGSSLYKDVIQGTAAFLEAELMSPEGGFYAALDADSEGVEGKFYVWQKTEIEQLLGEQAELFSRVYDVSEAGNWEQVNILRLRKSMGELAKELAIEQAELEAGLAESRQTLLNRRSERVRPQLDDKVILGWNALMNSGYSRLYAALQQQHYLDIAIRNMDFLLGAFDGGQRGYFHTYKNGIARHPAFLDDYAFLIEALIQLQEVTGNQFYIDKAVELTERVIREFSEDGTGFFFYTPEGQQDIIVRKKEIYDGAVPSGNSIMCWNLYYLGTLVEKPEWKEQAIRMMSALAEVVKKYPTSFGVWATNLQAFTFSVPEIALIGAGAGPLRQEILATYIPTRIFQSSPSENSRYPLLAGKPASSDPLIYLCKNYSCQNPVREVKQLIRQLEDIDKL